MKTVRSKDGTTIAFDRSGSGPALPNGRHVAGPDAHGEVVPAGAGSDGVLSELKRARS